MAPAQFDYIIVGGGSAGSALAARLSADATTRVLVLEAGRPDFIWDPFIHMPAALTFPIGSQFYDWKYESEPEPYLGGRRIYHARGKVLGGSSSINGMIFQRGNPLDYQRWGGRPGHVLLGLRALPAVLQADGELPGRGARDGRRAVPRSRRAAGARARAGHQPAVRRVLLRRPAGRLLADQRRQRLPAGGVRRLRPEHLARTPAVGGAGLPAPGHVAAEPEGGHDGAHDPDPVLGDARDRGGVRAARWGGGCRLRSRPRPGARTAAR